MVIDDLFGVVHTAVTDFYGVAVKYFAEATDYVSPSKQTKRLSAS